MLTRSGTRLTPTERGGRAGVGADLTTALDAPG